MKYRTCPTCGQEKSEREFWWGARRCRKCVAGEARAKRRTSRTYYDWALHRGADPRSPYVPYRCDRCGRRTTGQVDCEPRNWFRIPDQYDAPRAAATEPRRIPGLVCSQCGDEWVRVHRNRMVELAPDIGVTRRVHSTLRGRAAAEVPRSVELVASERLRSAVGTACFACAVGASLICHVLYSHGLLSGGVAGLIFTALACGPYLVTDPILTRREIPLRRAHSEKVVARLLALARERQATLADREAFYTSPEWRQLRAAIIFVQGNLCAMCGRRIANASDVTVDHVKPRSRHPHLALARENLRVLCRSCNSRKGAQDLG